MDFMYASYMKDMDFIYASYMKDIRPSTCPVTTPAMSPRCLNPCGPTRLVPTTTSNQK